MVAGKVLNLPSRTVTDRAAALDARQPGIRTSLVLDRAGTGPLTGTVRAQPAAVVTSLVG